MVTRHGSGSFVNTQSLDAVATLMGAGGADGLQDIFEMRHLLEPQIAALAARRATTGDVARLSAILEEQQQQILEGETGVDADTEFHFTLATATHNPALVKVVNAVEDVLRRSRDVTCNSRGGRSVRCALITIFWKWCAPEIMPAPAALWTITSRRWNPPATDRPRRSNKRDRRRASNSKPNQPVSETIATKSAHIRHGRRKGMSTLAVEVVYRGIFQKTLARNIVRSIVFAARKDGKIGTAFGRYGDSPERNGIPAQAVRHRGRRLRRAGRKPGVYQAPP